MLKPELDYGCINCATCRACANGVHSCCSAVCCVSNGTYHICACTHLPAKDTA